MGSMSVATIEHPERAPHPPGHRSTFLPRNLVKCGICYAKGCPSARPSVSHSWATPFNGSRYRIRFAPHDRGTFLVSGDHICNTESRACGRNDCVKQRHPLATAKIGPIIHDISETCKIYGKMLLFTHRKSHIRAFHWYRNWWPSMTLNGVMAVISRNSSSTAMS